MTPDSPMQSVESLSRQSLEELVRKVQGLLYVDLDTDGREFWNPDKYWNGSDVCEDLNDLLAEHRLIPPYEMPAEGFRVELSSDEHGGESFFYANLSESLAAIARLYYASLCQQDGIERRISLVIENRPTTEKHPNIETKPDDSTC